MDRTKEFYIYPKTKHNKRTGHVICVILRDGCMFQGIALCAEEDNFSYKLGRQLSKERAESAHVRFLDRKKK